MVSESDMKKRISVFLALTAVLMTVAIVWQTHRPVAPRQATWGDVLAEAGSGGYHLISTDDLADRYRRDASGLLLIDTRQPWEYRSGHIAGALNFPMEPTWWARWRKAGEMNAFLGSDKDRMLIFY